MHKAIDTKNTEFRAEARFQRCSPQKAKLVLDMIKGLRVEKAINTVAFTNKRTDVFIVQRRNKGK